MVVTSSPCRLGFLVCSFILLTLVTYGGCLNFSYSSFRTQNSQDFLLTTSASISQGALQITPDTAMSLEAIKNTSGRILFKEPLRLWSKKRSAKVTSFNTSFVMGTFPVNGSVGEGLAFIMTSNPSLPMNSHGMWLGVSNGTSDGTPDTIFAIEFDTRKSYPEDGDQDHIGVDQNSIYSFSQKDLINHGMNISDGSEISVSICYDGVKKELTVDLSKMNISSCDSLKPVIPPLDLDLSKHLPEEVYVGFSGSNGDFVALNYILSWSFASLDNSKQGARWLLMWILMPLTLVLSAVTALILFRRRRSCNGRHQTRRASSNVESVLVNSTKGPRKFRLKELKHATMNFDPKNKLGEGGFGAVYRGLLRESNEQIAVKRVSTNSRQGVQEFVSEVTTIGKLSHKNLARLVGWCCEKNELLLVYEFLSNGSLDKHLFCGEMASPNDYTPLSWEKRHKILCGVASALSYLHDGCHRRVLHRDVKASNVMIDTDYNARLGDFGLARTIEQDGHSHHTTHVIAGTPGYIAPEYCISGKASAESDVYGFGALALEVATGKRPSSAHRRNYYDNHVIDWVWNLYGQQRVLEAVDPNLNGKFDEKQVETLFRLGLACCHPNPKERPTIRIALQVLTEEVSPPAPPVEKPSFVWPAGQVVFERDDVYNASTSGGRLTLTIDLSGR